MARGHKARFGQNVNKWFQQEAQDKAVGVSWDSDAGEVVHTNAPHPETESPLCGSDIALQTWEVLEDKKFDCAFDGNKANESTAEIAFDLKHHFPPKPRDPQGTEGVIETSSQGSFRTNASAATLNIRHGVKGKHATAATTERRDGGAKESHDENSE